MKVASKLVWVVNLQALIGRRVRIETHDGHYRTGMVAGIDWSPIKVLGMDWDYPSAVRFELDDADTVPWTLIKSIELARASNESKKSGSK